MRTVIAAAFALVLLTSTANAADWCNGNGQIIEIAGRAYVTWECGFGTGGCPLPVGTIYAESNGEPRLQRGGADLLFGEADSCQDSPNPDLFVAWW